MTPQFSKAIDPIFTHVLTLMERIDRGERPNVKDERAKIRGLIDQAEAALGKSPQWELAKYGICSWIDELLVETPWDGQEWWNNNVLEVDMWNQRICYTEFYKRANESGTLGSRDALEVYYVCAVLGFRGVYRNPQEAHLLIEQNSLPPDLETWTQRTSMAIRLGQDRPQLAGAGEEGPGARPLEGQSLFIGTLLSASVLLALNAIVASLVFLRT